MLLDSSRKSNKNKVSQPHMVNADKGSFLVEVFPELSHRALTWKLGRILSSSLNPRDE